MFLIVSPPAGRAAAAAPPAAEPAEPTPTTTAAESSAEAPAKPASESAAEATDAAERAAHPVPGAAAPAAARGAAARPESHQENDEKQDEARREGHAAILARPGGRWHFRDRRAPLVRDALNEPRRARQHASGVVAATEFGQHLLPDHVAGVPVIDELLERVADFDAHLALVARHQHEQAVVRALLADARLLEQPDRVIFDGVVPERR